MKNLEFSTISADDFYKIYDQMTDRVRHDLDLETFFTGNHIHYGRITLYQPKSDNKAILLQHGSISLAKTG